MRYLISLVIVAALFLPAALADNCGTVEKSSEVKCPYMKAAAEGKADDYAGKVCPVTGKKVGDMKLADAELKPQTTCPVMGGKINKELYVDHDGKRIYLCCAGCVSKVKADPEKYIRQLEDQGIQLETVDTADI